MGELLSAGMARDKIVIYWSCLFFYPFISSQMKYLTNAMAYANSKLGLLFAFLYLETAKHACQESQKKSPGYYKQ